MHWFWLLTFAWLYGVFALITNHCFCAVCVKQGLPVGKRELIVITGLSSIWPVAWFFAAYIGWVKR
jgi:hypothetical protein